MTFYIFLWGTFFLLSLSKTFNNKIVASGVVYTILLILAFFIGFRQDVGIDWPNYVYLYQYDVDPTGREGWQIEPLYRLSQMIFKYLGLRYEVFFFTLSFFSLWCIYDVSKRLRIRNVYLVYFVYVSTVFCSFQFNIVRTGLMASCIWEAISYITLGNKRRALIWALLGSGFHYMGLILVIIVFAVNHILKPRVVSILLSIALLSIIFKIGLVIIGNFPTLATFERIASYTSGEDEGYGITFGYVFNIILFTILFRKYRTVYQSDIRFRCLLNSFLFALVLAGVFNIFGTVVSRIGQTLNMSLLFLWPYLLSEMKENGQKGFVFIFLTFYLLMFYHKAFAVNEGFGYCPIVPFVWKFNGLFI